MLKNKSSEQVNVGVVVPSVVSHALDVHTGIPFMPHMAAYLASALRDLGCQVRVVDCFGEDSSNVEKIDSFYFFGLSNHLVFEKLDKNCSIVFVYCRTIEDLISTQLICKFLRMQNPKLTIVLFENIQTVNSFSLKEIVKEMVPMLADIAVMGEPEVRAATLVKAITELDQEKLIKIPGIAFFDDKAKKIIVTNSEPFNKNLDSLSMPAWDLFCLEGYWNVNFGHAPTKKNSRFLPLLTSRGCPYRCTFCVSPAINPTWRYRSPINVVNEIEHFYRELQITDFHVSDLDPTISDSRIQAISTLLVDKNLPITWKIAQGTKIETIKSTKTLDLMKKAGCVFFSFSPETGSEKLLEIMNKKFDKKHANTLVKHMSQIGMRTQACFIAGVPGESWKDRLKTISYIISLVSSGVDEIAMTIFTPIPGAELSKSISGFNHYSELTHSPKWRSDYFQVNLFRYLSYLVFFTCKLTKPKKVFREFYSIVNLNFETKMEMSLYKFFKIRLMFVNSKISRMVKIRSTNY
jgi:radical SAM superfamily enzyme YgiQ (UPF0313 family)